MSRRIAWLLGAVLLLLGCQLLTDPAGVQRNPTTPAPAVAPTAVAELSAPSPLPTPVPPSTATPLPSPTATPLPSPTPTRPGTERQTIGFSVQGRPIEVIRFGTGPRHFVAIAALHGGHECNTNGVASGIIARLMADPTLLPPDVTLFVVPLVNPDGCALNTRENANGVDLNRNWDTDDWVADAEGPYGTVPGSGGTAPFSEPETRAVRDWLLSAQAAAPDGVVRVISYHSAVPPNGLVQPGYSEKGEPGPPAGALAIAYANATGYPYSATWVGNYTITGEFIHWANDHGFVAIDVELPDRSGAESVPPGRERSHMQTHLDALLAVLESFDA